MKVFDKYAYYQSTVQNPAADIDFMRGTYRSINRKSPLVFREDFCGTFMNSVHWVNHVRGGKAYGVDIDREPLDWGRTHNATKLDPKLQKNLLVVQKSVLAKDLPSADIICALNFSYMTLKKREDFAEYLKKCRQKLNSGGLLFMDCMGGTDCQIPNEEVRDYPGFRYTWELETFDPIHNHANYSIHYRVKGGGFHRRVFTYDWRMWSIPEIREMMEDVGFRESRVYWEGNKRNGEGNGVYSLTEKGEPCETWIAYIVGVK
jgi:hypothetical protein